MDGKRIRAFYANATAWNFHSDAESDIVALRERQAAEFDRWLEQERAVARREGQAEAWDEAVASAYLHEDKYRISIEHDPNPYEEDRHADR